jgi:hypothetical protein
MHAIAGAYDVQVLANRCYSDQGRRGIALN